MKANSGSAFVWLATLAVASAVLVGPGGAADRPVGTTYRVVDTGQMTCYGAGREARLSSCPKPGGAYFGQDANYTVNLPSYTDNGDGTITDNVTGLMWEKGFRNNVAWLDALVVATKATTGGYSDWRVPTIKELYSLIDFQGTTGHARDFNSVPSDARPFIDTRFFDFEYPTSASTGRRQVRYIDAQYITTTAYVGLTMGGNATFFGVNFADGRIKGYPQRGRADGAGWYLRLVRGNAAYGRNDFRDNGDGTVADKATGLVWMKADSGDPALRGTLGNTHYKDGRMDWPEALRFCEALSLAGKDDWRLPDAKQLQSLLDYTRSPQATRSAAIDPLCAATAITDEAGKPDFAGYWASTTHLDGREMGTNAAVVYFGEALGTMSNTMQGGPGGRQGTMQGQGGPGEMARGGAPGGMRQGGGQGFGPPPGGMQGGPGMMQGQQGGGFRPPPPGMGPRGMGQQGATMGPPPGMQGGPQGMRGQQGAPQGMRPGGQMPTGIVDVHGAGAQRSDPKIGNPGDYPKYGQGPQGDVRRVYNYVRCVRIAG